MDKKNQSNKTKGRIIEGKVVSGKQQKTVIVEVEHTYRHPIYKKTLRRAKRFAAHSELPPIAVGDRVRMQEVKPMSKTKHFIVIEKL